MYYNDVDKLKNTLSGLKKLILSHKKISLILLIIFIVIALIIYPKSSGQVQIVKVTRGDVVRTVSVTGSIAADKQVDLTFQIAGTLAYLGVKKGDSVNAYQTIATLDQRTAEKNLQQALINYDEQRISFDETNQANQNRTPDTALNQSMHDVLMNNQYDLNKAVISVQLQDLANQLSVLTTPISGIVTRTDAVTAGVNITPLTTFTVTDPNSLNFSMDVDESDIGNVKVGQDVNVALDAFPNTTLRLKVKSIDFVSHQTSSGGTAFTVKTDLPYNDSYRVGMSGNADIITEVKKNVLTIPLSSVMDDNTVFVQKPKGYFVKTKVNLGVQSDIMEQVISGLSDGEVVAVDPSSVPQQDIRKQ